jgi:hypothetical protein
MGEPARQEYEGTCPAALGLVTTESGELALEDIESLVVTMMDVGRRPEAGWKEAFNQHVGASGPRRVDLNRHQGTQEPDGLPLVGQESVCRVGFYAAHRCLLYVLALKRYTIVRESDQIA